MATKKSTSLAQPRSGQPVQSGILHGLVGFNLRRVSQQVAAQLTGELAELDFRPHQFTALSIVVDNPGIIQSALAQALGVERSNLVDVVDDLESRELITRNPVEGDRRSYALHPTAAGTRFRTKALGLVRRQEARLMAPLNEAERSQLLELLHRIAD